MTLSLGIIGAGAIGATHARAALAGDWKLTAVADLDAPRAAELAQQCGAARHACDPLHLFDAPDIDALVIAAPNFLHKPLAIAALRAGKHVLLEKPMGLTADECRAINAAAAESRRILRVGFAHRFTAVGRAAKQVVDAGELGPIHHVKAHLYARRGVPGLGGWFTTKAKSGGGVLIDVGVHLIDLAAWLLDHPVPRRICGKTYALFGKRMKNYVFERMWAGPPNDNGVCDVEDAAHAMICFDDDLTMDLHMTWASNLPDDCLRTNVMALLGERGGLAFELFGDHLKLAREEHGRNTDTRVHLAPADQFVDQLTGFARAIRTGQSSCATGEEGLYVQSIVDAIYQSSESHAEITLEPHGMDQTQAEARPATETLTP